MTLIEAYQLKKAALMGLQTIARNIKLAHKSFPDDQIRLRAARHKYNTACQQYDNLLASQYEPDSQ